MADTVHLSVIVPCYNEQDLLQKSHARLTAALEIACRGDYEIVYVDDGSTDATFALLEVLAAGDRRVRVVQFSRNFGHQPALIAGLAHSTGAYAAILDSDMQDPPELLGAMLEQLRTTGADVVYGLRTLRRGETLSKKWVAKLYYRLLRTASDIDIPLDTGDFRVLRRAVVQAVVDLPERRKYVRGLTVWLGFRHVPFPYVREARMGGEAKYTVAKLVELALIGFTSFGSRALGLPWVLLPAYAAFVAFIWAVWVTGGADLRWLAAPVGLMLVLGALGVLGLFLGRMLDEVRARPMYVIRARLNIP